MGKTQEVDDTRYTYAVARINALSNRFLDRTFASRMLAAEPDEIIRMLGETTYSESFAGVDGPGQLETGLLRELRKTHDLLGTICPDKELIRLFRIRYDFHNLKAMLKSRITGIPHTRSIMDLGTFGIGELSTAVREEAYRFVPSHLRDAALDAMEEYEREGALYAISSVCDISMWRHLMQEAVKHRNKIVIELFCEQINLVNIKTFVRMKEFKGEPELFTRYFIPGGSYSADFFLRQMGEQLTFFLNHLRTTRYEHQIVSYGFRMWPDDKSFWRLEAACDNFVLEHFSKLRLRHFSIAPLIYHLLRKEAEAKLIRTVVKCKLIGMTRELIEERLRYIYV